MNVEGMKKARLSVVAAVMALLVTGCGSGSDVGSDATVLTPTQFVRRANEICEARLQEKGRRVAAALERFTAAGGIKGASRPKAEQEMVQALLVPFEGIAEELSELPAAARDEAVRDDIVEKLEAGFEKASNPRAFVLGRPFAGVNAIAKAHGIKACTF